MRDLTGAEPENVPMECLRRAARVTNQLAIALPSFLHPSSFSCPFAISHVITPIYFFLSFSSIDLYLLFSNSPSLSVPLLFPHFFSPSLILSTVSAFPSFRFPFLTLFFNFLSFLHYLCSYFSTSITLFYPTSRISAVSISHSLFVSSFFFLLNIPFAFPCSFLLLFFLTSSFLIPSVPFLLYSSVHSFLSK